MRSYLAVLTSAVALLAATPAAAEGFRAEIHGGWDHTDADDEGDSGVLYGIGIGYDWDIGQRGT
jgi:opacity protein-like surface antigen